MKKYSLKNNYLDVVTSTYGANILSVKIKDRNSILRDVVLGYDDFEKYERQTKYIGATIGRCCNRIKKGEFFLDGKKYKLTLNDGENHLHGGVIGFDKKEWEAQELSDGIKYSYLSKDGEENYPGNLDVNVIYKLCENSLRINFIAKSDSDTLCNLTNHSYFNLDGDEDILNHYVAIYADNFTENDDQALPTGKIIPVKDTPMDFTTLKRIGDDIDKDYYQINYAKGFDNNWVINGYDGTIRHAARAFSPKSGITLDVFTDLPGIQFYSGNFLDGAEIGKNNIPIKNRSGFCLECQYFPNAPVCKNFPRIDLKAGEVYNKTIIYKFS